MRDDKNFNLLNPWHAGQVDSAAHRNEVIDAVNKNLRTGMAIPSQVKGAVLAGGGGPFTCKIKVIHKDHLTCEVEGEGMIEVARARDARCPASDTRIGVTFNYTYTSPDFTTRDSQNPSGGAVEKQLIWTEYKVDALIEAIPIDDSGITEAPDFIEHTSARQWAEKPITAP